MGPRLESAGPDFSVTALGQLLASAVGRGTVDRVARYQPFTAYLLAVAMQQLCLAQYAPLPELGTGVGRVFFSFDFSLLAAQAGWLAYAMGIVTTI